jgi:hypothetical protein
MPVLLQDAYDDTASNLLTTRCRYLRLKIKELDTRYQFSTNPDLESATFTLIPDKCLGGFSHLWIPLERNVTFKTSSLNNVTRLTFELFDADGSELNFYDTTGYDANSPTSDIVPFSFFNNLVILDEQLNGAQGCIPGMSYTNKVMQVQYNLIIGVVENNMNTLPNFS